MLLYNYKVKSVKEKEGVRILLNNPHGEFIKKSKCKWVAVPLIEEIEENFQESSLFIIHLFPKNIKKCYLSEYRIENISLEKRGVSFLVTNYMIMLQQAFWKPFFKEAISLGLKDCIEIWPKEKYEAWRRYNQGKLEEILEKYL